MGQLNGKSTMRVNSAFTFGPNAILNETSTVPVMISDSYHANFDLVSDPPSDVVNQGLDTIFGGEKIMIEVFA